MNISRSLRASVVTPTVLAGLVLATLSGIALAAAPAANAASPAGTATTAAPAGAAVTAAAPDPAGTASGFLFYVRPEPQPICAGLPGVGLNATADPSIDRAACAFTEFQVAGHTGAVTADLYLDGQTTPFATDLEAAEDDTAPGTFQVALEPDDTWPAGRIRMVVEDTTGPMGEFFFGHNQLVATLSTVPPETAPGTAITVNGTIEEHSARSTFTDTGVPATFTLKVFEADGSELHSAPVTAANDGTFTANIPPAATAGITAGPETNFRTSIRVAAVNAAYDDTTSTPPTGEWAATVAGSVGHTIVVPATNLLLRNSFVSSVGWVKPGDPYSSRIIVSNPTTGPLTPTIALTAPTGTSFVSASGPGSHPVSPSGFTWAPGAVAPGATVTLVVGSTAATDAQLSTIVWRDLSATAVMTVPGKPTVTSVAHGPKVIPPSDVYDTARYGDRPFPVVPVQYTDRAYQSSHSGDSLDTVINDPANEGSTFNLFQEMSLKQLFPQGTVPSAGVASADFASYAGGFDFSNRAVPGNTCRGFTYEDFPGGATANPLYTERITDGVYNLPGQTEYYGSDSNGSALIGAQAGVGQLQDIDSGCGDTGKLVYDAAVISDPEIDFSDYDTDKDGVVDFFMVVFAGCGGHGASQVGFPAGCPFADNPPGVDNVWPHSSSLEGGFSDPVTGLPGYTTDDQLKNLEGQPLWYTDDSYSEHTTTDMGDALKVYVRVGPYNVNPETAIDDASVISHEYGHSLGLPDFYSTGTRETYGTWTLMGSDHSQNIDAYGRQELGWVVPRVLDANRAVTGMKDSKEDIGQITWKRRDGTPYTLQHGPDGTVHNSEMYVAKLPGRRVLDPSAFTAGDGASPTHVWWSGSGNDFNCPPEGGRNFDLSIPELRDIPAASTVTLSFKSRWDIEWDYDYGFVLTSTDAGKTYTSNPSEEGYTTSPTTAPNAPPRSCQVTYDNGITGSSGSYDAGTEAVDRVTDTYPEPVFLADSYDISELAGADSGALRFSYTTDPGVARPGWFIDDVKITVDEDGTGPAAPYDVWVTDFESSGGPDDSRVFNGGCRENMTTAQKCTLGWKYLQAGAESLQDHAYYMEMRDRSGFDLDGNGEADRGPATFQPGFYLSYTDEAHGYGNFGTDDPPAQSPLDSVPTPGDETPNLDDAAFVTGGARATFTDSGEGHTDNYVDPSNDEVDSRYPDVPNPWRFRYNCLGFEVTSMSGQTNGPEAPNGDLTGDVAFTIGAGCGPFNYGYVEDPVADNTAPKAQAKASPNPVETGDTVTLSADGTTDTETPNDLDYSWDFGDDGTTKDAEGKVVRHKFPTAGSYKATVTVTDPQGARSTASVTVVVKDTRPAATFKIKPKKPFITTRVTLSAAGSTGLGLTYSWNFGDGGSKTDATGQTVRTKFKKPGYRTVRLTVTDTKGRTSTAKQRLLVRRAVSCSGKPVTSTGSWRVVSSLTAPKGDYCDNLGRGPGRDTLTYRFRGKQLDVYHGRVSGGGTAAVFIDGKRRATIDFGSADDRLRFRFHKVITGLSKGRHTVRLVVLGGKAYLDSFITVR